MISEIGAMAMPAGFKYRDVYLRGKPRHERLDSFSARHPPMSCARRAKLFHSFDALKGFGDAVADKEVLYEEKRTLTQEETELLNERIVRLWQMTRNGRLAREHPMEVEVTYFEPCRDKNHAAYGEKGRYLLARGVCRRVDPVVDKTIAVGDRLISLFDVAGIEGKELSDIWQEAL